MRFAKQWWSRISGRTERDFVVKMMPRSSVCAEVGVYKGDFSERIIRICHPRKLFLIDPWRCREEPLYRTSLYGRPKSGGQAGMEAVYKSVLERFSKEIERDIVEVYRATSGEAVNSLEDESLDWVYIDGNHLYEFVLQDLTRFSSKVKSGGFITGDDYGNVGWWEDGVTKAVNEFIAQGSVDPILISRGQYILRKT